MRLPHDSKKITFSDGVTLTLYAIGKHGKIFEIDAAEAEKYGEAPIQILESKRYEYVFSNANYTFRENRACIVPSKREEVSSGFITPGNYVGTLDLYIENPNETVQFQLEVLATKFDTNTDFDASYRTNYRAMVEAITEKCTELLMQSNSPVNQYFEPDFEREHETLYQKFSFVKSILDTDDFDASLLKIFTSPKTSWINKEEYVDVRSIKRFSNSNVKALLKGSNRMPVPENHPLRTRNKLESIPAKIVDTKQEPSLDTPENRFIKHALTVYLRFCERCNSVFPKGTKVQKEAAFLTHKLENFLNHSFFKEISRPATLQLNSPTLQRKGGYRQLLKSWLMFELASQLTWTGTDDAYRAGKRDIATLYEYWLFFVLYDVFKHKFGLSSLSHEDKPYDHLLEKTKHGLNLIIKSGEHTALRGDCVIKNRELTIQFSFNRTFSGHKDSFPKAGSWTTSMRPDYTLSVWPQELTQEKAEEEEQIVHIHFDAKYKVHHFDVKTNHKDKEVDIEEEREALTEIKEQERAGNYKNADLLKMHAYKDAIRRTGGAYILYPGTQQSAFKGFHELIPGLGAFSLNPNNEAGDVAALSQFIDNVIHHLVDRASRREHVANKLYAINKNEEKDTLHEPLPEYIKGNKLIPDETFVLVGFYKSEDHLNWILNPKNKKYNFRAGKVRGSFPIGRNEVQAKYLVLHGPKETITQKIYQLADTGVTVYSNKDLIRLKYPTKPTGELYLMFPIYKEVSEDFFNPKFDLTKLKGFKNFRNSPKPITRTLTQILNTKIKED